VFTSVHGDMHGAHGLLRKAWPYEESVRVPLLIRPPRVRAEIRHDAVSLLDLPHMAVAWAEGRTWKCKRDSAALSMPTPTPFPLQCDRAWRGFRTPRRKLILNADGTPWLFFDLAADPWETTNLVGDPACSREIAELSLLV